MAKLQKIIARLQSRPSDFGWGELKQIMEAFGYELKTSGGSGRKFIHSTSKATLFMQEPHPSRILKAYRVKDAIYFLKQERHIP